MIPRGGGPEVYDGLGTPDGPSVDSAPRIRTWRCCRGGPSGSSTRGSARRWSSAVPWTEDPVRREPRRPSFAAGLPASRRRPSAACSSRAKPGPKGRASWTRRSGASSSTSGPNIFRCGITGWPPSATSASERGRTVGRQGGCSKPIRRPSGCSGASSAATKWSVSRVAGSPSQRSIRRAAIRRTAPDGASPLRQGPWPEMTRRPRPLRRAIQHPNAPGAPRKEGRASGVRGGPGIPHGRPPWPGGPGAPSPDPVRARPRHPRRRPAQPLEDLRGEDFARR